MKRVLCVLLCLCCLLSTSACKRRTKESPVKDFTYEMVDGEVVITGYIGTDLEIYIPSRINNRPVTTIGREAFSGYDMKLISIPDSVVLIERYAFYSCECLTSIKFSSKLETISDYAFEYCEALTNVTFPKSLKTIGASAFESCTSLRSVSLPNGLESLGENSFARCEQLEALKIPDNTHIGIYLIQQAVPGTGYVEQFKSPVGGSVVVTLADSKLEEYNTNKEFKELPTKVIVSEGSFAHEQVRSYSRYGLIIEIE